MLTAYMDESGIHDGDHLCVVAGFLGDEDQWKAFIPDWQAALGDRTHLHMKELRWAQKAKPVAALLSRLGPIPVKHGLIPIVGGMCQKDYREVVKGRLDDTFTSPYMMTLQLCFVQTLKAIPESESVAFVFEQQEKYEWAAQYLHDVVFRMNKVDDRMRGVTFVPKGSTHCTEPADYLAFQVREYNINHDSPKAKMGMSILGDGDAIGHVWEREQIQSMVDEFLKTGVAIPKVNLKAQAGFTE